MIHEIWHGSPKCGGKKTTNEKKRKKRKEKDMPDDQRESATATDPITKEKYFFLSSTALRNTNALFKKIMNPF